MNTVSRNTDLNDRDDVELDGDRGIPQVGRKKAPSRIWFIVAVGVLVVLIAAMAAVAAMNKVKNRNKGKTDETTEVVSENPRGIGEEAFAGGAPPLPEGMEAVPPPANQPAPCLPGQVPTVEVPCVANYAPPQGGGYSQQPQPRPQGLSPAQQAALDLAERRKRAPVTMGNSGTAGLGGGTESAMDDAGNDHGALGKDLTATRTGAVAAARLHDPNLTITQGRMLPCTLETALSSQVSGMTSCVLTRDIYSTNGRVLLMERGTRIVGQYQAGQLKRGLSRIFVLWTRAETPNGVVVTLDSPAADALGRSGVTGKINKHFWERFGAALLISLVDDFGNYQIAKQQARRENGDTYSFSTGSEAAEQASAIIVQGSLNIPPTLETAQGTSLSVFVARDLYFGQVYALRPTGRY